MSDTDKTPQRSAHREQVSGEKVAFARNAVERKLMDRLNEKGWGTWSSRHELLGFLTEEYHEVVAAVQTESMDRIKDELIDVAVGCIFGIACIDAGLLDW